jgi:hypothetical protein
MSSLPAFRYLDVGGRYFRWSKRSCVQSSKSSFVGDPFRVAADRLRMYCGKTLVELVEVSRDDESVVPDLAPVSNRERVA